MLTVVEVSCGTGPHEVPAADRPTSRRAQPESSTENDHLAIDPRVAHLIATARQVSLPRDRRLTAIEALLRTDTDVSARAACLVDLLGEPNDRLAFAASNGLEELGISALPALESALRQDGSSLHRFRVARTLSRLGRPAVAVLVRSLDQLDGVGRFLVVEALAELGPVATPARERLQQALHDDNRSVRLAAARTLASIGADGRRVLEDALHDDEEVHGLATEALSRESRQLELTEAALRAAEEFEKAARQPAVSRANRRELLVDATIASGISFRNVNGAAGSRFMVETVGFGAGWIDFDRDGYLDLYLVQGHLNPQKALDGPDLPNDPGNLRNVNDRNTLYRNRGDGTFEDVSERAGVADRGYGMGVAVGDYDRDGYCDLYVTNYGRNTLYRNRGDGTFEDVTERAGVEAPDWSTSASWADFDGDGNLDLYVVSYVEYDTRRQGACLARVPGSTRGIPAYCDPSGLSGVADVLYRNRGDGTFEDVSERSSVASARGRIAGKGLGVTVSDFDNDGDPDVLVATDKVANTLWRNLGGMRFEDVALETGFAFDADGEPRAGMGIACGDVDGDGRLDYLVTNFSQETNTLYRSHDDYLEDATTTCGLGPSSYSPLGFGARLVDVDLDGDQDLYVTNGHVLDNVRRVRPQAGVDFGQRDLLLENDGQGHFRDVSVRAGSWFLRALVGRAVAEADYDNDGDPDLLVTNVGGPAVLLENTALDNRNLEETTDRPTWIGLELVSGPPGPVVENALVYIVVARRIIVREVQTDGSFLSAHDARLRIGLAGRTKPVRIDVRWRGESRTVTYGPLEPGRYHVLRWSASSGGERRR
jgi:hypothetical protein